MSFTAQACSHLASQAQHSTRPPQGHPPAHYQAHGRLYRAIVSLPPSMCERDRPLQERWVFFDCPNSEMPHARIEALLALAWNIDTTAWCSIGLIYSIASASDLIAQGDADDDTALFECAWGGPDGTQHVPLHEVDFFCTPRVRARLELALHEAHICWATGMALGTAHHSSPAQFWIDWSAGNLDLPYQDCSVDEAYSAYLTWCQRAGDRYPLKRNQFTPGLIRYADGQGKPVEIKAVKVARTDEATKITRMLVVSAQIDGQATRPVAAAKVSNPALEGGAA